MILQGIYEGSRFLLYALCEPDTLEVRYVGLSTTGLERPRSHWRACSLRVDKTRKARWLRTLKARGQRPVLLVLEEFATADGIGEAERRAIAWYREQGARLTNATEGGETGPRATGAKPEPPTLPEFWEGVKQRLIKAVIRDWEIEERCREEEREWLDEHFGVRSKVARIWFPSEIGNADEHSMDASKMPKAPKSAIEAAGRFHCGQKVEYKRNDWLIPAKVERVVKTRGELWLRVRRPGVDMVVCIPAENVVPAKVTLLELKEATR